MKIIITENQLNKLLPDRIQKLYKTDKETESYNPDIDFKLKFKNRIDEGEYYQLSRGAKARFDEKEETQLSLLFGDYRKSQENLYGFKFSKRVFGEPAVEIKGIIAKFKSYYLVSTKYEIRLPHSMGRDYSFAMFYDFDELLKFLKKLISMDIPKQ